MHTTSQISRYTTLFRCLTGKWWWHIESDRWPILRIGPFVYWLLRDWVTNRSVFDVFNPAQSYRLVFIISNLNINHVLMTISNII